MEKEIIEVNEELLRSIVDNDCKIYKIIDTEDIYIDLEKSYCDIRVICKSTIDNKFYAFQYLHSACVGDEFEELSLTEVFPVSKTIIVYE